MVNYKNGLIYTIRTGDSVYVGSTCNFNRRKQAHKGYIYSENSKKYGRKLYKTIRDNDGEWVMKPYKEFSCENKTQLTIEEERVRVGLNADLNIQSCHGSDDDYYKKYYIKNKEKVKQYNEDNKEHIKQRKKQYRLNNIEVEKKRLKEYYEKNKEEVCEKNKMKTICECGCEVRLYGLPRHKKTAKHIKMSKMGNP